jgi:hypothetical protein
VSNTTKTVKYKDQLLDHFIEAALDAIKRARAAWLLGIIIVFIFGGAVFNATLSWNDDQITRRASLYGASVKGYDAVKSLTEHNQSIADALNQGKGELGYLQPLWEVAQKKQEALEEFKKSEDNTKTNNDQQRLEIEANDAMKELKSAAFSDLNAHIARRNAFDTVGIPFIGVYVTGSDYGIIGGIALIIVGYWLLAMLRREHLVLSEFVKIRNDGHLIKGSSNYEPSDLIYACNRIKHYMVFSIPEPGTRLSYVTTASFFAAPFLLLLNHILTVKDIYNKHLGTYWQWHVVVEGLVVCLGIFVWFKGWRYQYDSMQLMQLWEIECGKKKPFPSEKENEEFQSNTGRCCTKEEE